MIGNLVLAGLGLIPGIKETATILTVTDTMVDPVWKTKIKVSPPQEDQFDLYVIEDCETGSITYAGIEDTQTIEFLVFIPIALGQHFERSDGTNYQVHEFEILPGVSKEMYLGKARMITTGERT